MNAAQFVLLLLWNYSGTIPQDVAKAASDLYAIYSIPKYVANSLSEHTKTQTTHYYTGWHMVYMHTLHRAYLKKKKKKNTIQAEKKEKNTIQADT